ncbi:hypothetical protein [Peristeroidobacter agariperforans]|uniref:hypothetical protein n=1 Tax=Peristeroidobacter agariperforans TaxID=268404 RepID=UPI00101E21CA|nr:hypothetical protein [Peristeroidobacter agariperforans]
MSRPRKRRHRLPPGKFATIPVDHLKRAAAILSASELRVWLALCAQSQPWSNGTAKLCRSVVKEFHLGSWTTVSDATQKLIDAKLIVRTRKFRPRHCALYGVTHMPLNYDAMEKANAVEAADQLATDSCSKTLATDPVARTNGGSSKLGQNTSDSLQRLYRIKGKNPADSLQVLYQSKTLPSPTGISGAVPPVFSGSDSALSGERSDTKSQ